MIISNKRSSFRTFYFVIHHFVKNSNAKLNHTNDAIDD